MSLIHSRVDRLEMLLEALLVYSRVGRKHNNFLPVDIDVMVESNFQLLDPPEGFRLIIKNELPPFETLKVPLEQVILNLISNAIKHHDSNEGVIEVSARSFKGMYEFSVSDDGPGIPPEHQERVFQIFQTLKSRDEVEGSGMGLAMVSKIIDNYRGEISIKSDGVRGTSITFTWPEKDTLKEQINE